MLRKGFTLIELLIVITIIAILAGAAIPYVQDYVEDARISKTRADLDEIKNALIRYELDSGKVFERSVTNATITIDLVGPYLAKAVIDPWGGIYGVVATSSVVHSMGPDGASFTADDIYVDFRPPLALSKAYWIDANKNGMVDTGDQLKLRTTREVLPASIADQTDVAVTRATGLTMGATVDTVDARNILFNITALTTPFVPGSDTINLLNAVTDKAAVPIANNPAFTNRVVIKAF